MKPSQFFQMHQIPLLFSTNVFLEVVSVCDVVKYNGNFVKNEKAIYGNEEELV